MEPFEAVRTVMAVREYADREVPTEVVGRILEAGRLTASSTNLQPWHFVVVRERKALRELGRLVKTGPYIAEAALALVVGYERESRFGVSDASRAIQSMIITAWAEGVGSNWAGFGHMEEVRSMVGLPEEFDVLAVIAFGYPKHPGRGRKRRKPLSQVASRERFGGQLRPG